MSKAPMGAFPDGATLVLSIDNTSVRTSEGNTLVVTLENIDF